MVSVIIPNYNHAPFLQQRINSVLNQTYKEFEIIILDDSSTDHSKEIIELFRKHPKVTKIIYNEVNSGSPFRQWQKGIELAKGELIWIAESDDYSSEIFLEHAVKQMEVDNSFLFFCQSYNVNSNSIIVNNNFWWTENIKSINWYEPFVMDGHEFIKAALQFKAAIPNASGVVFRKDNFDFSTIRKYRICGDWLFWINALKGQKLSYSPQCLNYFRTHPNTTRNLFNRKKMLRRQIEELAIKYELSKESGMVNKEDLKLLLNKCIDVPSLSLYPDFLYLCFLFNLPFNYILKFINRKIAFKF